MSSEKWHKYKLGELVDSKRGISYGIVQPGTFYDKGIPIVKVNNLTEKKIDFKDLDKVSIEVESKYQRTRLRGNEILISLVGTLGYLHLVDNSMIGWNVARAVGVLPIDEKFDKNWIYWYLKSPSFQETIRNVASTSVQATLNLKELNDIEILYPQTEAQRNGIVNILTALDDKIELNRRMNETLEGIAQAVWGEWFGKYASGEEELPEGWKWVKIGDVCEVNQNTLSKKAQLEWIDYIEISEVNRGKIGNIVRYERGTEPSRAKRRIQHGDIVLSTVRPDRGAYFLSLHPEETIIVSTGFAVFTAVTVPYCFLYILLTQSEMLDFYGHMADGGAYPAINPSVILEKEVAIPETDKLYEFQKVTEHLFEKIQCNNQQSRTLTALRDTLLPQLMRGEINLS